MTDRHLNRSKLIRPKGGVKLDVFNGKLSTTLSYYSINVTNILRADAAHPNFSIQNGTQLSKGFEAEVIANPFTGFNLTGGFAYNDSKYTLADADVQGLRPKYCTVAILCNGMGKLPHPGSRS